MKTTFALAALSAVAYASPRPQGVTANIAPSGSPPAGFSTSYTGNFQITAVNITSLGKRDLQTRAACGTSGSLTLSLANSVLLDGEGRTGYIADNYQFQFDKPAQTGAIYTSGWSVGSNGSLALGSSAVFYQCLSGSFYNLYDRSWAPQCTAIVIEILPCGSTVPAATQASDGQPAVTTAVASQLSDGQPQVPSAIPVSQLSDGQPQVPTNKPATVTSKPAAVTQISDGQIQAPTATKAPITQISDGQIQAPTSTKAPITQISDGQIQAPTGTPNATATPSKPAAFTGSGAITTFKATFALSVMGFAAVFLL